MFYNNTMNNQTAYTLGQLNNIIQMLELNQINPKEVEKKIHEMESQNLLRIVGKGTNRIAVSVMGDITPYLSTHAYDNTVRKYVIKIPYTYTKGVLDNKREFMLYRFIEKCMTSDPDCAFLANTLPVVSRLRQYPLIFVQEEVEPIEREFMQKGLTTEKLVLECSKEILVARKQEYIRLMTALTKVAYVSDLNPLATPMQFGFKYINGRKTLTILDTGYALPKIINNDQNIQYLIWGVDLDVELTPALDQTGGHVWALKTTPKSKISKLHLSSLQEALCKYGYYIDYSVNLNSDSSYIAEELKKIFKYDMSVFMQHVEAMLTSHNPVAQSFMREFFL